MSSKPPKIIPSLGKASKPKQSCLPTINLFNRWTFFAVLPIIFYILYDLLDHWIKTKSYVFSTQTIADIANEARLRGGTPEDMMNNVTAILHQRYGTMVEDTEWIFIRSGGWMGAFRLQYASLTEYVLLFGTAIPTSGHSGRYLARIEDTILTGKFIQWEEGKVIPNIHYPGKTVIHEKYEATGVAWEGGTWMVERGVGLIPTTLPFALGDTLLSAQDFYACYRMFAVYAKLVTKNLLAGRI